MSARDELGNPITQQRWETVLCSLELACTKARENAEYAIQLREAAWFARRVLVEGAYPPPPSKMIEAVELLDAALAKNPNGGTGRVRTSPAAISDEGSSNDHLSSAPTNADAPLTVGQRGVEEYFASMEPRSYDPFDCQTFHELCMDYRVAHPLHAQGAYERLQDYCRHPTQQDTPRTVPRHADVADAARVIAWARDPNRKPANTAFTAGAERQTAYWIEWAESPSGGSSSHSSFNTTGERP